MIVIACTFIAVFVALVLLPFGAIMLDAANDVDTLAKLGFCGMITCVLLGGMLAVTVLIDGPPSAQTGSDKPNQTCGCSCKTATAEQPEPTGATQ